MEFEKNAEMIMQIDQLIRLKNTGPVEELTRKLNIGKSLWYEILNIMKAYGANIEFDRHRKTYYYVNEGSFDFHFREKK